MCKKLIVFGLVMALAGVASALVVGPGETWETGERMRIPDGYMEVYGTATFNARVDFDEGDTLIIYDGGKVIMNNTCKFPDSSGDQNVLAFIHGGGLWDAHDIENRAYDRGDHIGLYVSGRIIVHQDFGSGNREYDPYQWVNDNTLRMEEAGTIEFTDLGGGAGEVHGVPEPATIMLLGLGGLALIRRKR